MTLYAVNDENGGSFRNFFRDLDKLVLDQTSPAPENAQEQYRVISLEKTSLSYLEN